MMQYDLVRAERISDSVVANIAELVTKLCEDEPAEVRQMVWRMVEQRLTVRRKGCFRLPPMEEC